MVVPEDAQRVADRIHEHGGGRVVILAGSDQARNSLGPAPQELDDC